MMDLDIKNSYFYNIKEVKELSEYFGWNKKQILKYGHDKKLLNSARYIKEMGI